MSKDVQFGDLRVPVAEAVNGGMTGRDLSDTTDAMWKTRSQINEIMSDMTLDECQKLVEMAADFKKGMRSKGA